VKSKTSRKSARKSTSARASSVPSWDEARERAELQATFRDRLLEVLARTNMPTRGRAPLLAQLTHRAKQGTSRWLGTGRHGSLPDVIALRQIALAFNVDPAYLLGLTTTPRDIAQNAVRGIDPQPLQDWLATLDRRAGASAGTLLTLHWRGEEMEPTIERNSLVIVEAGETVTGAGLYALSAGGEPMIRRVETTLAGGVVLRCDNPRYGGQSFQRASDVKRARLRILGRVAFWVSTHSV